MHRGCCHVHRGPRHAVRRPASHPRDLLAFQALHECGLPVNRGRAIALLAMVIVTPSVHLSRGEQYVNISEHFLSSFKTLADDYED